MPRKRLSRKGRLTAEQKSAEGIVDSAVGKSSEHSAVQPCERQQYRPCAGLADTSRRSTKPGHQQRSRLEAGSSCYPDSLAAGL